MQVKELCNRGSRMLCLRALPPLEQTELCCSAKPEILVTAYRRSIALRGSTELQPVRERPTAPEGERGDRGRLRLPGPTEKQVTAKASHNSDGQSRAEQTFLSLCSLAVTERAPLREKEKRERTTLPHPIPKDISRRQQPPAMRMLHAQQLVMTSSAGAVPGLSPSGRASLLSKQPSGRNARKCLRCPSSGLGFTPEWAGRAPSRAAVCAALARALSFPRPALREVGAGLWPPFPPSPPQYGPGC